MQEGDVPMVGHAYSFIAHGWSPMISVSRSDSDSDEFSDGSGALLFLPIWSTLFTNVNKSSSKIADLAFTS